MVPVFRGDLSTVLGAIAVCRVYENVLRWSLEELRPRLADLIRTINEGVGQDDPHSRLDISKRTPQRPSARGASTDPQTVQPKVNNKLNTMTPSRPRARSADIRDNQNIVYGAAQSKAQMSGETHGHTTSNEKGLSESFSQLSVGIETPHGIGPRKPLSRNKQHNSAASEEKEDPFCGD